MDAADLPRILAIEADAKRKRLLTALVREHVGADLLIVDSVKAAVATLPDRVPEVILAPTLLSPQDGAELIAHVKALHAAPYVQVITLPALDMLAEPQVREKRRFERFIPVFGPMLAPVIGRRTTPLGLQYDAAVVGMQIADAVDRARAARAEQDALLAYREPVTIEETALVAPLRGTAIEDIVRSSARLRRDPADDRRVASRRARTEVPWLSAIKLSWGPELHLVNISSTGVLVETGSKLTPGSTTELHLSGPETNLVVPVRVVRSDVARIDGLGVRYHAAARFDRELDLSGPRPVTAAPAGAMPASPPQELAALLGAVLVNAQERPEPAHVRFAQGLRQLIGARDVQVRSGSASGAGGRETLYFDVPGDDRAKTTLQVMFDRHHHVSEAQFKLLRAAAWLTAAVIELDAPTTEVRLLSERVA